MPSAKGDVTIMDHKLCPHCGFRMNMEENPKVCLACQGLLAAAPDPDSTGFSSLRDEDAPPANTGGEVDSIGAYGQAADASWEDPAEKARAEAAADLPDVPEEVLEARKNEVTKQNNMIGLAVIGVFALLVMLWMAFK